MDLTAETVTSEAVPAPWLERYVGGKGLGARYLYDEVTPSTAPLDAGNRLFVLLGPFSGHLPGEPRIAVVTKSPLTGLFLDSYVGGSFAEALSGALEAHIGLVIHGQADTPVRLDIEADRGVIRPADELWGRDCRETAAAIDGAVACPGPAGERHVAFATIATDGGDHQAGRGGSGAVMGAKRLKAIVASGDVHTPPALAAVQAAYEERLAEHPLGRWHLSGGTLETIDAADTLGILPTAGWQRDSFEGADTLGIDAMREQASSRERETRSIPGDYRIDDVAPRGALAISLGSNLGIDDFDAVVDLGRTCDRLGLDVIETGNAVAWAIHAARADLFEYPIDFNDADAADQLITDIATRSTALGDRLANGIDAASESYGGKSLIPTIKSMSAATYDPRRTPSMALAYATSDRGACHRRARPIFAERLAADEWSDDQRVHAVIDEQNRRSLLWCYVVDDVTAPAFDDDLGVEYFTACGTQVDSGTLEMTGERIWTLTRLFNVREGASRSGDRLPATFTQPTDATDGPVIDSDHFSSLLDRYYQRRGWSTYGIPTLATLERLDVLDLDDNRSPVVDGSRPAGD